MSEQSDPIEPLIPVAQAAEILNMSMKTFWRRVKAGELAVVRDDGVNSVVPADLRRYIEKRRSVMPKIKDIL